MDLLFCFFYVVNILIFSPDEDAHVQNLRQVFELLLLHGLHISLLKCVFAISKFQLLGHNLSSSGCSPYLPNHFFSSTFRQTCSSETPGNFEFLQGIYQEFSFNPGPPHQRPQGPCQTVGLDSTPKCSFPPCSRHSLHSAHPPASRPWCFYLPSSGCLRYTRGWGTPARHATILVPLAFFSRKLSDTKTHYSAFDHELLAAF